MIAAAWSRPLVGWECTKYGGEREHTKMDTEKVGKTMRCSLRLESVVGGRKRKINETVSLRMRCRVFEGGRSASMSFNGDEGPKLRGRD